MFNFRHPDVDRLEDDVQNLTVRWENVCSQVADRLKTAEEALHTQMVYRSAYENEIAWLNRVENTINGYLFFSSEFLANYLLNDFVE